MKRTRLRSVSEKRKALLTKQQGARRAGIVRKKKLATVGKQKAKRQAANREYYTSPEWRAKKKAVHARDDYQCTEMLGDGAVVPLRFHKEQGTSGRYVAEFSFPIGRCPNRGEVVNGKQTARGLVAEETGYQHRGIPDAIDRIRTRCKDCDRRQTPLERINHAHGFNRGAAHQERGT